MHSTTTSIAGWETSAFQSSPMWVVRPSRTAASRLEARVGDAGQVHAGRARDLRQVHRAELAGADEADADGLALGLAAQKHLMQ